MTKCYPIFHEFWSQQLGGSTRIYSPELRRWLSRDPIGQFGGVALYVFIRNRTITSFDTLGLVELEINKDPPYTPDEFLKAVYGDEKIPQDVLEVMKKGGCIGLVVAGIGVKQSLFFSESYYTFPIEIPGTFCSPKMQTAIDRPGHPCKECEEKILWAYQGLWDQQANGAYITAGMNFNYALYVNGKWFGMNYTKEAAAIEGKVQEVYVVPIEGEIADYQQFKTLYCTTCVNPKDMKNDLIWKLGQQQTSKPSPATGTTKPPSPKATKPMPKKGVP